ncbi:MAG: DUF1189 family protein [Patescibacteria group bacterium]
MNRLKTFWRTGFKSLTDPEYYSHILKARFTFSFKYLFLLLFFVFLVKTIFIALNMTPLLPKVPSYVKDSKEILKNLYPPGLTIMVKNGILRTNVDEPYFIPFPKKLNIKDTYLAVIDTQAQLNEAQKYKTVFFVTKNAILYPDTRSSGGYKVFFLNKYDKLIILNQDSYNRIYNGIVPYFKYLPVVIYGVFVLTFLLLPVFGALLYMSGIMMYLIILTFVLFIIARLLKKNVHYGQLYRMGMHGITFSILFDLAKSTIGITIPYTFVLPFFAWMIIVLVTIERPHVQNKKNSKTV